MLSRGLERLKGLVFAPMLVFPTRSQARAGVGPREGTDVTVPSGMALEMATPGEVKSDRGGNRGRRESRYHLPTPKFASLGITQVNQNPGLWPSGHQNPALNLHPYTVPGNTEDRRPVFHPGCALRWLVTAGYFWDFSFGATHFLKSEHSIK